MGSAGGILAAAGLAFAGLGIVFSRHASAAPAGRRTEGDRVPQFPSGTPQTDPGYSLAAWAPIVVRLIPTVAPRTPQAFAIKWIEIESGGNPCAVGDPGQLGQGSNEPAEIGLGQLYNPDDFTRLHAPPVASFRAYAPAAAPLAQAYRQAQADYHAASAKADVAQMAAAKTRMTIAAQRIQSRTRALTPDEMEAQVRWTVLAKIAEDIVLVDHVVHAYNMNWQASDYWKLVKAPHALPAILGNGFPAVVKKLGRAPRSWAEFRNALGMDGNSQWVRALNACEACGNAVAQTVA